MTPLYLFLFTKIASTTGFLVVAAMPLVCLVLMGKTRIAKVLLVAMLGLMAVVEVLKDTFRVPRPEHDLVQVSGYALPSGHAAGSIFLAIILGYFASSLRKPLRYGVYVTCGLVSLAIGISRFQLGVHTPFQIVVGYALGAFFAIICIVIIRR